MRRALVLGFLLAIVAMPGVWASYECTVYRDGYVHVIHSVQALPFEAVMRYEPLGTPYESFLATDPEGVPLFFSEEGEAVLIYTLGSDTVTVSYDTPALTAKEGALWTYEAYHDAPASVTFPEGSSIISFDPVPDTINLDTGTIALSEGLATISYVLLYTEDEHTENPFSGMALVAVVLAVAIGGGIFYRRLNRAAAWGEDTELDAVENRVMAYIAEKGTVLESEIRMQFDLPKTSSWRMVRRLEAAGHVTVKRKNRTNVVRFNKRS